MPTALDLSFALLFTVIVTALDTVYFVPQFKADVNAGVPGARLHAYQRTVLGQWAFAAAAILLWMRSGRPWSELGIIPPTDGRMIVSVAIVAAIIGFTVQQVRAIGRTTPERRMAIRPKLAFVEYLLPHSRDELRWFTALSITAGVCEELLYRGFLFWVLKAYVGVPLAAVIGVSLFGVLHIYQGKRGALKAGIAGLVMMVIVLLTGWLFPAMVVHALVDLGAGVLGFAVLSPSDGAVSRAET
jgi:membrane protease YdiL (CAAX protease family)